MRFKVAAAAIAIIGAVSLLAPPVDAAPKKKRVVYTRGHTVQVSRDENGRTRTRVIVQKRSYLNPGTERFPGERGEDHRTKCPGARGQRIRFGPNPFAPHFRRDREHPSRVGNIARQGHGKYISPGHIHIPGEGDQDGESSAGLGRINVVLDSYPMM